MVTSKERLHGGQSEVINGKQRKAGANGTEDVPSSTRYLRDTTERRGGTEESHIRHQSEYGRRKGNREGEMNFQPGDTGEGRVEERKGEQRMACAPDNQAKRKKHGKNPPVPPNCVPTKIRGRKATVRKTWSRGGQKVKGRESRKPKDGV